MAITVRRVTGSEAGASVEALAAVLIDCVEGGASLSFMWPLSREKAVSFWQEVADEVARGCRALVVAEDEAGHLIGTVSLILDLPENQPHRADVAKMLVHRSARRRGVARQLMNEIERVARVEGRTVLVLDTLTGGAAEQLYAQAGWHRVGVVPRFALLPDGQPCDTTYFFKHL